jgi:hypothetical protein
LLHNLISIKRAPALDKIKIATATFAQILAIALFPFKVVCNGPTNQALANLLGLRHWPTINRPVSEPVLYAGAHLGRAAVLAWEFNVMLAHGQSSNLCSLTYSTIERQA